MRTENLNPNCTNHKIPNPIKFIHSFGFGALLLVIGIFPACQPPRSPVVITKSLEVEGKPKPKPVEVKPPEHDIVRIGIRVEISEASVACSGPIDAMDLVTNKKESWPPGRYVMSASQGQLLLDGHEKGKKWRLRSQDSARNLVSGNNSYRGDFVVRAVGDKVTIVNELTIDDYLKGVLPREASVSWPDHALRVQAVASRTYLASHLGSHSAQGFDLCSDVHCQVYGGMTKEHPSTNAAVEATHDEILVYDGRPIGAYFHSHCGGSTEQIEAVWGNTNKPYLPRKKCTYCKGNPRYSWKISMSASEILAPLRAKTAVKGEKLKSLRIKKKSLSGRAEWITVNTEKDSYTLRGNEFRIALNPEKIRSTLFTNIERHGDGYTFEGRGWGHGVGMCQWGAKGQSELGKDYRDILQFYYPHTELKKWSR